MFLLEGIYYGLPTLYKEATLWPTCRTLCPSEELVMFFLLLATLLPTEGIWRKGISQKKKKKVKRIDKKSKDTMTAEGMARTGSG